MSRFALALDLKDDPRLIAEYVRHHQNVWPEILESIASAGITDMQIYHVGDRLFMILETDDSFDPEAKAAADAANPKVQEWERLMDTYQRRLPFAAPGQKWVPMELIFSLQPSA